MDLERVGLHGDIDAEKLLRIMAVAEELGLRVIPLANGEPLETGTSDQSYQTDVQQGTAELETPVIRRPLFKHEFTRYVDERLAAGEKLSVRSQKGAITRVWGTFMVLHKREDDLGKKLSDTQATIERLLGVKIPQFESLVRDQV
jgi:hypothetical protein